MNLIYQVIYCGQLHHMVWKGRGRCLLHVDVCPGLPGHCINEWPAVSVDFDSMNPRCLQVSILWITVHMKLTRWIWALHLHIPSRITTWNIMKFMHGWCQSGSQLSSNGHAWKRAHSKAAVTTETIRKRNITFSLSHHEVHISPHHITTFWAA